MKGCFHRQAKQIYGNALDLRILYNLLKSAFLSIGFFVMQPMEGMPERVNSGRGLEMRLIFFYIAKCMARC